MSTPTLTGASCLTSRTRADRRKLLDRGELAQAVFEYPLGITKPDPRHDDRWITIGEVPGTLLVVVHTDVEKTTDEGQIHAYPRHLRARCRQSRAARLS